MDTYNGRLIVEDATVDKIFASARQAAAAAEDLAALLARSLERTAEQVRAL